MATELTHYGAKVIHQFIELDGQFEKALQKKETFTHTEYQGPQLLAGMKWK